MRKIVTFERLGRYGRFANQQFQMSGTIGIARRNGFNFGFPPWRNHAALNFGQPDLDVQARFENPLPLYSGPRLPEYFIPFGYKTVRLTRSVSLLGYLQSERYFSHCLDEVKFYFRMKDEPPVNDYCAIHWRAGDYGAAPTKYKPKGNAAHPRMTTDYYKPAMALFGSAQKFLVFSDDLDVAKKLFGSRVEYSEGLDYLDDFRLMKSCKHFIISNSSYSLMAAILGEDPEKQVVGPSPWFGGEYARTHDERDILSPGWHVVNYETGSVTIKTRLSLPFRFRA
jgi:hypothetical protein